MLNIYDYMELTRDNVVAKIFVIYSKFSIKGLIELNATFRHSPDKTLALLHKPRKPKIIDEITGLMHDESV